MGTHWLPGNHRRSSKQANHRKRLKPTLKTAHTIISTVRCSYDRGTATRKLGQDEHCNNKRNQWEDSRVEDNHICVQFHFYHTNRASNILLAGLPTPSSLLPSLLPFATAAGCHSKTAAKPGGWGGRWLEEPRVKSKISLFYVFNRGSIVALYYGSIFQ